MASPLTFAVISLVLCIPASAADPVFEEAVAKAARISGRWEATLDQSQSPVFSPDRVSRLILNILTRISREDASSETAISDLSFTIENGRFAGFLDGHKVFSTFS